jgi:hypothetical protein
MNSFTVLKNPITNNYLDLKNDIFGDKIAWLYHNTSADYLVDGFDDQQSVPLYLHNVLQRPETNSGPNDIESRIRSGAYARFKIVIDEIFDANGIKVDHYHRISVNSCCNVNKSVQSPIHVDHTFEHNQMLIYLTDSSAPTNIYTEKFIPDPNYSEQSNCYYFGEEKMKTMLKIFPHEDQIVTFDGLYYHSYDYPIFDKSRRILVVCTYS